MMVNKWDFVSILFLFHFIYFNYACSPVDNSKYVEVSPTKQCRYMVAKIQQHVGAVS